MKMKTRQKFIIVKKNDTEAKCYNNVTFKSESLNRRKSDNVGKVKSAVLKKQYRDFENPTLGTNLKNCSIEKTTHIFQNPSKIRQD